MQSAWTKRGRPKQSCGTVKCAKRGEEKKREREEKGGKIGDQIAKKTNKKNKKKQQKKKKKTAYNKRKTVIFTFVYGLDIIDQLHLGFQIYI